MPINCQLTNIDYQEYFFGKENLLLYFVPTYQTQLAPWKKKNADKFQWFLYEYVSILALILASPALKYKKHLAVNKYLSVLPLSPAVEDTPYPVLLFIALEDNRWTVTFLDDSLHTNNSFVITENAGINILGILDFLKNWNNALSNIFNNTNPYFRKVDNNVLQRLLLLK